MKRIASFLVALALTVALAQAQTVRSTAPAAGQIPGTVTNDNAAIGNVGQYTSAVVASGSPVALTNNTAANITSVSLTAGDWDCNGNVIFAPAGTTVETAVIAYITTVSVTLPTSPNTGSWAQSNQSNTGNARAFVTGTLRISVSATTTVYLGAFALFTVSTNGAYGFIGCRRMR